MNRIDWNLLSKQKEWLLQQPSEEAAGLVEMLDWLQDHAVDREGIPETTVFPTMNGIEQNAGTDPRPADALSQLNVENALLRGNLFLTASALKDYHDSPHFEIDDDGVPKMEVIVPESLRQKAADALARAQAMLKDEGRGR